MWFILVFHIFFTKLIDPTIALESGINCSELQHAFANSTSEFVSCAIQNSRPITLCEQCVQQYINVLGNYSNLEATPDNGTRCLDRLINLDRLQIVQTLYMNSYNLWNKAKCYECFQEDNGSLTPNPSNQTNNFNNKLGNFSSCINQTGINDTTICPQCMASYVDLDNYYTSISNENERIGVCMDIVDKMNTTRLFWSVKCCKYRKHNEYVFIASTVGIFVMTICFYILSQCLSERKTPAILQQTRFGGTLNYNDQ